MVEFCNEGDKSNDITLLVGIFAFISFFCAIALNMQVVCMVDPWFEDPEKKKVKSDRVRQRKEENLTEVNISKKKRKNVRKAKRARNKKRNSLRRWAMYVRQIQVRGSFRDCLSILVRVALCDRTNQTAWAQMAQGVMQEDFVLNQHSCIVQYDASRQIYRLVSHSKESLVVCHNPTAEYIKAQENSVCTRDTIQSIYPKTGESSLYFLSGHNTLYR